MENQVSKFDSFLNFARKFEFKCVYNETEVKKKKFLGITIKSWDVTTEKTVYYNDFYFGKCIDGNLSWGSGGGFRPEGYFWGGKDSSESIKNRLIDMVNQYNLENNTNLTVEDHTIIFN